VASVTATSLTLPATSLDEYEQVEGMSVFFSQPLLVTYWSLIGHLVVTEFFKLARYGQVTLADQRAYQFTYNNLPDQAGYAEHVANQPLNRIVLDDGSYQQNLDTISFCPHYPSR
jgi:predicted extracellular nuclease